MATLHGRNARIYIGLAEGNAAPVTKVSSWGVTTGVDFQEDTAQGDNVRTYVPGLSDFSGNVTYFLQDTDASQDMLIDAALAGTKLKYYAYPGLGAGVANRYWYGEVYASLTDFPADVGGLITNAFDLRAAGPQSYKHP